MSTGSQPPGSSFHEDRERLIEDLGELIHREPLDVDLVKKRLHELPGEDIARCLQVLDLDPPQMRLFSRALSDELAARVLDEVDEGSALDLIEAVGIERLPRVMEEMPPDEGADLLAYLEPEQRRAVLQRMDPEHAKNLRELEKFDPETAGGLMTNEFRMVRPHRRIEEVIQRIRDEEDEEDHQPGYIYVVDELRNLIGVASLKQLMRADPGETIGNVMQKAWLTVPPDMDREEVARIVDRYHLYAVPVTDDRGSLLGVVTSDDVMDVIEEEVSEDMYRLAGAGAHNPFAEPVLRRVWFRLPWLTVTMLGGFASVAIIGRYEDTIRDVREIAFFIPIIGALAGNVGVQASTIMVRGFATGDIPLGGRAAWNLLVREMAVGSIIGAICGVATGAYAALFVEAEALRFGLSVGLSIFGAISAAAAVGTLVPLACSRLGVDPALAAGPFIVTVIDIFAHLIYFVVLTVILLGTLRAAV